MPFRNPKYIYYGNLDILDLALAAILLWFGLTLVLPTLHIDQTTGSELLIVGGGVKNWGWFFCVTSLATITRLFWPTKPNRYITNIIKTTTNFCYTIISWSLLLHYPFLPETTTYVLLAGFSWFSTLRYDQRHGAE